MTEKILFVDDDRNLLAACERNLRRRFQLETAESGHTALALMASDGPFAVVVADRQMPGMDGIEFLSRVRQQSPDTIRMMLTGNADLEAAIRVVNEGNIFRFLTKPCPPEMLAKALEDALAQSRLVRAEKELLSKTLSGSIKLFTDILSIVDPTSFGRAQRLRDLIVNATDRLEVPEAWEIHLAVMLAPIGSITVPPETLVKARAGQVLSKAEELMMSRLPEIAARLLSNIPRLEGVSRIVRYQHKHFDGAGFPPDATIGENIPLGARLLKILTDMVQLQEAGRRRLDALVEMQQRVGWYDPALLSAVSKAFGARDTAGTEAPRPTISVTAKQLVTGMVLRSDVETKDGTLILASGHELNETALEIIQNFENLSGLKEPIFVEAAPG
ncbi:MAG TPA: HD domain-containing phosphohydrolase [Verrucomicrobiae bacterium]|nr:HD domain-containing phosphohydrolase [Verrucomicrobiae bacterium]